MFASRRSHTPVDYHQPDDVPFSLNGPVLPEIFPDCDAGGEGSRPKFSKGEALRIVD